MANISQTTPHDWKYVSEGGATIVFSYTGPPNLDYDGTVLRLRKSKITNSNTAEEKDSNITFLENDLTDSDDPIIEYQTKCLHRLIPTEHLPRLETVEVNRSWLEELSQFHNATRPESRRVIDEVDLSKRKGVLATDLVGGDWLAVEIKPKWAFLPSATHLSEETKIVKTQTCRFCMHNHLKAQKGQEETSEYCPLDLFSGDEERVLKAIHNLWDAWVSSNATANNLKIFARGKFVTPSETHLMLAEGQTAGTQLDAIRDAFASSLLRSLLRTPVFRILSELQRNLDSLDIEGLSKLWRLTESSLSKEASQGSDSAPSFTPLGGSSRYFQLSEPNISDWTEFLDIYTSANKPAFNDTRPSVEALHYHVLAYLLSATFKDCSVIIKLDFIHFSEQPSLETPSDSVTIIDLDPKSMDKLKDWEKLDQQIALAYASVRQKTCIDAWKIPESISS